jgi:hypothetical protein
MGVQSDEGSDAFVCAIMHCWCFVSNGNARRKKEM